MKTYKALIFAATLAGWLGPASAQQTDPPEKNRPAEAANANEQTQKNAAPTVSATEKGLRLNFRGVPLEMVLNYLSEATDLIINIVPGTDVKGKVDVWSNSPLTKDEAVDLLNTILHQNRLTAIRTGRTLTIVSRDEAKTKDVPVKTGSDPEAIPKSDEMVTQIIPVKYANALQMTKDLVPLLPTYANLTANESGNALVLTATKSDVRRMVEIVNALDTSISSISTIRVFPLKFADAKELANAVKELFTPPAQQNNNDRRNRFFNQFRGGPGGGGLQGLLGGGNNTDGSAGTGNSEARNAASRVVAVADERANALVVSAPDEYIPGIEQLVKEIDVPVTDVTELRVFHLSNSDPMEMADLLAELFPDDTRTGNNNNNPAGFFFNPGNRGGRGGPFGNANRNNQNTESDRAKKMGRVIAVPDQRTSSLVVSAAGDLMPQIEQMIAQLDSSPAKKQRVFVYSLENADVQQVEQIVREMFDRSNTTGSRNNANDNSALINRSQQNNQGNQFQGGGFGNQGLGNRGGLNTGQFGR
jgi:general secretion pathway protein D